MYKKSILHVVELTTPNITHFYPKDETTPAVSSTKVRPLSSSSHLLLTQKTTAVARYCQTLTESNDGLKVAASLESEIVFAIVFGPVIVAQNVLATVVAYVVFDSLFVPFPVVVWIAAPYLLDSE